MSFIENRPIVRGSQAWPFAFLGSLTARTESAAMALVGQRALSVLGYDETSTVPDNDTNLNPSAPRTPAPENAVECFISSLENSAGGFKHAEPVKNALEMVRDFDIKDHKLFMSAMLPGKSHDWAGMTDTQRRAALLHAVRQAIRGPDFSDVKDAAKVALLQAVDETSPWRYALLSEPRSKALYSRHYSADTERQRETNTWQAGGSLYPMLEPSEYTDCNSPSIRRAARSILSMPRLGAILRQRISTGQETQPLRIVGPDDQEYTADDLEHDARYASLLSSDGVPQALASQDMKTLIANAEQTWLETVLDQARIDYLTMAQRIATAAIHTSVRDSIQYSLGGWCRPASEVLRTRRGSCFCCASLAVAMGRSVGIPCGLVRMHVELPGYFGLGVGPNQLLTRERISVHYYIGWITLHPGEGHVSWQVVYSDPSDDYEMAAGIMFNHPHTRPVVFNGAHHGLLGIPADYLYDRVGPLAAIDELAKKQAVLSPPARDRQQLLKFVTQQTASVSLDEAIREYVKQQPRATLQDNPDAHRLYKSIYRFMTECYPTHAEKSHDRFGWLCASDQALYLEYICTLEIPLDQPVKSVINYVLGNKKAPRNGNSFDELSIASICGLVDLPEAFIFRLMAFHDHLLSSVALAAVNLSGRFYAGTEDVRSCAEAQMEYEAWLHHNYPALASLHREEVAFHPDYEHCTIVYLLGRLCIQAPLAERQVLGNFIDMIEEHPGFATSEEVLDQRLKSFLGPGGPIEAFLPQRGDGLLKPYGVLYTLWKAYVLGPSRGSAEILRQLQERSKSQKPHLYHDWFPSTASSNVVGSVFRSHL